MPGLGSQYFRGRDEDLAKLHGLLQSGQPTAIRAALQGMGGVGKTELALQYARRYGDNYPGGICWLDGRGRETEGDEQIQYFQYTTRYLKIEPPENMEPVERLDFIIEHLSPKPALIILDDFAGKYPEFLTKLPEQIRRLITTRENPGVSFKSISIDVLQPGPALEFLGELIGTGRLQAQEDDAKALCKWLGHLPLAIELTGAYLANLPDKTLAQALADLKEQGIRHKALELNEDDPAYDNQSLRTAKHISVWAALELSRARLSDNGLYLALLLAQLGQASIPVELMKVVYAHYKKTEPNDFEERQSELYRLGLLEYKTEIESKKEDAGYRLHLLVREYFQAIADEINKATEIRTAVAYCLAKEAEKVKQDLTLSQADEIKPLLPHWEWANKALTDVQEEEHLTLSFTALVRYHRLYSDWFRLQTLLQDSLSLSETKLGSRHLKTATSLNNIAEFYRERGLFEKAEPLYKRAITIKEENPAGNPELIAMTLNNLAELYREQGRYPEAKILFMKALDINKKELGPRHYITANSLNNLAVLYKQQGNYRESLDLYQEALKIRKAELGSEHIETANTLMNLAELLRVMGNYKTAIPYCEESLAILERQLGSEHPTVAGVLTNLSVLYTEGGKYLEALNVGERALEIYKTRLEDQHHLIATSLNNLASIHQKLKNYNHAVSLYKQALEIYEKRLGLKHPQTAVALNNLAFLYVNQSFYKDAIPLYERALDILKNLHGNDHPDVITIYKNLEDCKRNAES